MLAEPVMHPGTAMPASWWSHGRATLLLGIPLIGAQLAQLGIHTTDVVIVGQLGAEPLAAMVLSGQFLYTVSILGHGIASGVLPMVAQAYGQGDVTGVRRSLRMGLWAILLYWLATLPVFLSAERILLALGQQPAIARLAGDYVAIAQIGLLPGLFFLVLRALVSAVNRAGVVLWATLVTLILNAALAYALVLGRFGLPAMGMTGAAIVSIVVQVIECLILVAYIEIRPETRKYEIFVRFWRPDWHALREVLVLGVTIGLTLFAETTLFTAASLMMGWIGTLELAAHGIALQLASIAFMVPLGLAQVATVRVGVSFSQQDYGNLMRAAFASIAVAGFFTLAGGLAFVMLPQVFAGLFLDTAKPEAAAVLALAIPFVIVAGIFQLIDGMQAIAAGLLRGLKDARIPMMLAMIAYWPIGFLLAYLLAFPFGFGGIGIWFGFLIGLGAAAAMLLVRFFIMVRRQPWAPA